MIVLRGGHLCDPVQGWDGPADLYLAGGRVAAVLPPGASAPTQPVGRWTEHACEGLLVTPGPVDTCCRLDLQRDPWSEDPHRLAAAAAAGGWTSLVVSTGSADPAVIASLRALDLPVRLLPVAAATQRGGLSEMGLLAEAGAVAVGDACDWIVDPALMRRVLEYAGGLGLPVLVRPEDPQLAGGGVMHEGLLSFAWGLRGNCAAAETAAVARDVILHRVCGGRLHFGALSSAESLPLLGAASAGVQAAHLLLTEEAVRGYDTAAKLAPPLRGAADRDALLAAVRAGRLALASGHSPYPPEAKAREYDYAAFGGSFLETALAIGLELLEPAAFVRACAVLPSESCGVAGGTLAVGSPADVAVFDRCAPWVVRPEALCSRLRDTPLAGRRMQGRAVLTIVAGRVVFAAGAGGAAADDCINMQSTLK